VRLLVHLTVRLRTFLHTFFRAVKPLLESLAEICIICGIGLQFLPQLGNIVCGSAPKWSHTEPSMCPRTNSGTPQHPIVSAYSSEKNLDNLKGEFHRFFNWRRIISMWVVYANGQCLPFLRVACTQISLLLLSASFHAI